MTAFIEKNSGVPPFVMTRSFQDTLTFSLQVFLRLFLRLQPITAPSVWSLINQIYFTSIQILPLFFVVSICFGVIFIGAVGQYLRDLGLFDYFGHYAHGFVVTEFAPFHNGAAHRPALGISHQYGDCRH